MSESLQLATVADCTGLRTWRGRAVCTVEAGLRDCFGRRARIALRDCAGTTRCCGRRNRSSSAALAGSIGCAGRA